MDQNGRNKNVGNFWLSKELPALEYCKIDRAAHLLKCEVNDLLHWASVGSIKLCVCVEWMPVYLNNELWNDEENKKDESLKWLVNEWNKLGFIISPEFKFSPLSSFVPEVEMADPETADVVLNSENLMLSYGFVFTNSGLPYGNVNGMWAVYDSEEQPIYMSILNSGYCDVDYRSLILEPADCSTDNSFYIRTQIENKSENTPNIITITSSDLWITKFNIEKIWESRGARLPSIITGEVKPLLRPESEIIDSERKQHKNSAIHERNRINTIQALILSKERYPDECKNESGRDTDTAWITTTLNHWITLGNGKKEPSPDHLRKLIREYLKHDDD